MVELDSSDQDREPGGPGGSVGGGGALPPLPSGPGTPRRGPDKAPRKPAGKPGAALPFPGPAKPTLAASSGKHVDVEKLRALAPEETATAEAAQVEFTPQQVRDILEVSFYQGSNALLRMMNRQGVTEKEAAKWAEVTNLVYGQYFKSMEAGALTHALVTMAILGSKQKLPVGYDGKPVSSPPPPPEAPVAPAKP